MAQKKISELTAVVLASGSAVLPIVQDGTTSKITFANLTGSILNVATAVTASHALTALSASYAVSASHEITYELSSSFAETATSASHALTSNTTISASYALTASHVLNANIETGQFAVTGSNTFIGNQIIDGTVTATTFTGSFTGNGSGLTGVTTVSASHALNANTASFAPGIRVIGLNDNSDFDDLKLIGFAGGTVHQQGSIGGVVITILTSSFATTASYAVTASVASDLYKPSGSISVGIGAESNIIQISGSLIQLGNPTLYTQTLVSRRLDVSGSLVVHNQLGNGFAGIGVDNAGDAQIGANNYLNILLKSDGTTTIYNGLTVSCDQINTGSLSISGSINTTSAVTASAFLGDASYAASGRWTVGANGSSDYTFTGVGFPSTTNDPIFYLARGRVYEFLITSGGSHPFQIRLSNGGAAYNDGVTNNTATSGVIRFEIPFNAPNTLYYQCTNHSGMGNTINIYPSI